MKKRFRILAILLVVLILACFAGMIVFLWMNRMDLFLTAGAVLFALALLGFGVKYFYKKRADREEKPEEATKEP